MLPSFKSSQGFKDLSNGNEFHKGLTIVTQYLRTINDNLPSCYSIKNLWEESKIKGHQNESTNDISK